MNSNSCLQLSKNYYLIYLRTHSQVWSHDAKFRENAPKNNLDTVEIVTERTLNSMMMVIEINASRQ